MGNPAENSSNFGSRRPFVLHSVFGRAPSVPDVVADFGGTVDHIRNVFEPDRATVEYAHHDFVQTGWPVDLPTGVDVDAIIVPRILTGGGNLIGKADRPYDFRQRQIV